MGGRSGFTGRSGARRRCGGHPRHARPGRRSVGPAGRCAPAAAGHPHVVAGGGDSATTTGDAPLGTAGLTAEPTSTPNASSAIVATAATRGDGIAAPPSQPRDSRSDEPIKVFLAYADEDRAEAERLFIAFREAGLDPWMDKEKLLPGENWPRTIERAIESSDFFCVCFSRKAAHKRGFIQSEIRYALDIATYVPLGDIFLVPVRLEECVVPLVISRSVQFLDLFPDWEAAVKALISMMKGQMERRRLR